MEGQQAIFAILAGFAIFLLTQTVIGWMRLTRIETRQEDNWRQLQELLELHPRRGNPGQRTHDCVVCLDQQIAGKPPPGHAPTPDKEP